MRLSVTNNTAYAHEVPPTLAGALDIELRYPTESARTGIPTPDGWDGWIRLFYRRKDGSHSFPTGLLPMVTKFASKRGYAYEIDDQRKRPESGEPWAQAPPEDHLRPYQLEAIEAALRAGRGVIDAPPRSGKTRSMTEIVRRLALPTLWTAPTDRICKQTISTLEQRFGAHNVTHLIGMANADAARDVNVVVATIATASALTAEWLQSREVLVVDEWHHAASRSYQDLFKKSPHVFYRLGMTGTHYRSGDDALAMQSLLSNTIYKIESSKLVDLGYLTSADVVFLPVPCDRLYGLGKDWHKIAEFGIWNCVTRNQLVAHVAGNLANSGRKVLVLCNRKTQGKMIRDLLTPMFPVKHPLSQFERVEFCSTDMARYRIDQAVRSFNELAEIKVLIGTSMLGEGVDLPAADTLVYARGEKAEVSLVQNAFRVCTAADGKPRRSLIIDFADAHHRKLQEHATSRLGVYHDEPIFKVHVQTLEGFQQWLTQEGHL